MRYLSPNSKSLVLGALDDFVLELGPAVDEIVAVAGDADDQVAVFLGMLLRLPERVRGHDVELDVVPVELEIRPHQVAEIPDPLVVGQELGREFLVEERSTRPDMVDLARGLEDPRRSLAVRSLDRRDAFAQGFGGFPAVGRRPRHLAEIDVDCGRKEIDPVFSALGVRPVVDRLEISLENGFHDVVGVIVVVAVLGCLIEEALAQGLMPLVIFAERLEEGFHRDGLRVEDVIFDRGQDVGHRAQADALDVVRVVARSSGMVVLALRDTIVDQDGEERRRKDGRPKPLDDGVSRDLDIHEIAELRLERGEEIVIGLEFRRVAGFQADDLPRPRVPAVVEGDLQNFGHVEVAGQGVVFLAECARLDAAARSAVPRVLDGFSLPDEFLNDRVGVENRGLAEPGLDDAQGPPEKGIRSLARDLNHGARLKNPHLFDDVEEQVRKLVDAVRSVGFKPAEVDQRKISIRSALFGGDADFRRGGLIVELNPEAFEKLPGKILAQRAVF